MRIIYLKYLFVVYLFFLINPILVIAQGINDSTNFYFRLKQKADKHKVTQWIYEVLIEIPNEDSIKGPTIMLSKKTVNPFLKYKGKIVRNVSIVVLDPFGYSVNNLYAKYPGYVERVGNNYHIETKERIIRNLLLFKPDKELDPLELSESERILRLTPYIYDARVYVQRYSIKAKDSVDIMVVVQDRWTSTAVSKFDLIAPDIILSEKNILGFGHQYVQGFAWNPTDQYLTTAGRYSIFNIKKSFISTEVFYSTAKENNRFGVSIDRPFYSPLAKWAGGMSLVKNNTVFKQTISETGLINTYPLKYNAFDLWGAKSFPLTQNKSAALDKRSSNFILGVRYYRKDYTDRPSFAIDTNQVNRDETLYLANYGFTRRKYYSDRYLFRYGANEDIPEGISAELVLGVMKKEITSLLYYSGIKFGAGEHFDNFGYFSAGVAYGTFFNQNFVSSGVIVFDAFYFSDLIKSNRWYFRQFSRFKLVEGISREFHENLNINGTQMYGFSSSELYAKSKVILNFEFVMYAPYKLLGFQFAPVILCGVAGLGTNIVNMFKNTFYQAYAIGVLIRNEYLISNTFQLSIGLYPYMPGSPDFTLKANPITGYNVKARDYFISKPDLVLYE